MPRRSTLASLKFREALTTKGLSSSELTKRLQALHKELGSLDQEQVDTKSLDKVSKELISTTLLLGKDRGVKAYVACCLADLLRLYAPDAPYTADQLRDIFQFFVTQLKNFTGPACPHFSEYFYLVESLSNVKSAVLICDVPGSDQLVTDYFKQFFSMARPDTQKNVMACLADILSQLVEEAQTVPADAVDVILAQFLPKNIRTNPSAVSLAVEVCNLANDRLQRYVAQYFSEVILNAVPEEEEASEEEEDMSRKRKKRNASASVASSEDFIAAHELIKQINRSCPKLLTNVIPQIEQELGAADEQVRLLASTVLGEMFAERDSMTKVPGIGSLGTPDKGKRRDGDIVAMMGVHTAPVVRSDLAKNFPQTWRAWLARSKDTSAQVRLAIVESFKDILLTHHELGPGIYEALRNRLVDHDERVRAAACSVFSITDYEAALHSFDRSLLEALAERIQDKKPAVQREALNSIGRLYNNAYGEILNGVSAAINRFAWLPHEVLKATLIQERELHAASERTLHKFILPLPSDASEEGTWVDRLLVVMQYLEDATQKALFRLTGIHDRRPTIFETYLNTCEKYNGGTIDEDEDRITQQLRLVCRVVANTFPDPTKAEQDLQKFAKINDSRLYRLLRTLMDRTSDLKTIIKTYNDARKRIEGLSSSLNETFSIFLRRSAPLIINQSCIPHLVCRMQAADQPSMDDDEDQDTQKEVLAKSTVVFAKLSKQILDTISKACPQLYKPHLSELSNRVQEEKNADLVSSALLALSCAARAEPDAVQRDSRLLSKLYGFALNGTPDQAKSAALFLAKVPDNDQQCGELVGDLADALPVSTGIRLISHLNALKRLAKHASTSFEAHRLRITRSILTMVKRDMDVDVKPGEEEEDLDWCSDEDLLPEYQACIVGLQVVTNICLARSEDQDAEKFATSMVQVFMMMLREQGRPEKFKKGPGLAGRFRLQAAISMLKLSRVPKYEKLVHPSFIHLALMTQDTAFQIRGIFIHKLIAYLFAKKFPGNVANRMMVMLFLTAHDPDKENILMARRFVMESTARLRPEQRLDQVDMLLVRLIHLLAHHPDFEDNAEALSSFVTYFEFFLDCLATRESIPLLYYLAARTKTVRDAHAEDHSHNMYILSELAQLVISGRAQAHGWPLPSHPGKVKLPGDIFKPLPSREAAVEIAKTAYLSEDTVKQLGAVGKSVPTEIKKPRPPPSEKKRKSPKPKKEPNGSTSATKSGSSRVKTKGGGAGKKRKKAEWEDDTDAEEDEETSSSEDGFDDEGGERRSPGSDDGSTKEEKQPPKARPSNLRQRPKAANTGLVSAASVVKKSVADTDEEDGDPSTTSPKAAAESIRKHPKAAEADTPGSSPKGRAARTTSAAKRANGKADESSPAAPKRRKTRSSAKSTDDVDEED